MEEKKMENDKDELSSLKSKLIIKESCIWTTPQLILCLDWKELETKSQKQGLLSLTKEMCVSKIMSYTTSHKWMWSKTGIPSFDSIQNEEVIYNNLDHLKSVFQKHLETIPSLHELQCLVARFLVGQHPRWFNHHPNILPNMVYFTSPAPDNWSTMDVNIHGPTFARLISLFPVIGTGRHQVTFDLGGNLVLKWFRLKEAPIDVLMIPDSLKPLWVPHIWIQLPGDEVGAAQIQELLVPIKNNDCTAEIAKRVQGITKIAPDEKVPSLKIKPEFISMQINVNLEDTDYRNGLSPFLQWGRNKDKILFLYDLH